MVLVRLPHATASRRSENPGATCRANPGLYAFVPPDALQSERSFAGLIAGALIGKAKLWSVPRPSEVRRETTMSAKTVARYRVESWTPPHSRRRHYCSPSP